MVPQRQKKTRAPGAVIGGPFVGRLSRLQILTIFTTVGFGDMSAYTTGETLYADWTMCLGDGRDRHGSKLGCSARFFLVKMVNSIVNSLGQINK